MRKLIFIILIMLWSGLAISLMNDDKGPRKVKQKIFKADSHEEYRPVSDRG